MEDRCRACGRGRPVLPVVGDCDAAAAAAAPARHELDARPADDRTIILRIRRDAPDLRRECGGTVRVGEEGGRGGGVGDDGGGVRVYLRYNINIKIKIEIKIKKLN